VYGDEDVEKDNSYGFKNGENVSCGGRISAIRSHLSKSGKRMAFLTIEDLFGTLDLVAFPNIYEKYKGEIIEDNLIEVRGKVSLRDGQKPSVIIDSISLLDNNSEQTEGANETPKIVESGKKLCMRYDLSDEKLHKAVKDILATYEGGSEVFVKSSLDNKSYKLNFRVDPKQALLYELEAVIGNGNAVYF